MNAPRHQGHYDHRRRAHWALRDVLRGHASGDLPHHRRAPRARRPAHRALSREVHLRRRGIPQDPGEGPREGARRAGLAIRPALAPQRARRRPGRGRGGLHVGHRGEPVPEPRDHHRGRDRGVLPPPTPATLRRAVVRTRRLRPRDRPGAVPRPARADHRRRRLGLRLGAPAFRSRRVRDADPSQRPLPGARSDGGGGA